MPFYSILYIAAMELARIESPIMAVAAAVRQTVLQNSLVNHSLRVFALCAHAAYTFFLTGESPIGKDIQKVRRSWQICM